MTQPRALHKITAELSDDDGGVSGVAWVWERSDLEAGTYEPIREDPDDPSSDPITSKSYTPANADKSYFLRVTANYTDALSAEDEEEQNGSGARTATTTTDHSVLEGGAEGQPPEFLDGDGNDVTTVGVEVAENSPAGSYVDAPLLEVTDPDGQPIYTLEDVKDGDDAKYFALLTRNSVNTRQLVVGIPLLRDGTGLGSDPPMDARYDAVDLDKEDDDANTFTVVLKATDGPDSDTLTVTVTVTDRNEAPSMPAEPEEDGTTTTPTTNNAPEFAAATDTRRVVLGTAAGGNIGEPVAATDADDDTLTYTLGGADAANFEIVADSGQLQVKAGVALSTVTPTHNVTVTADDGEGGTASIDVTITVIAAGGLGAAAHGYDSNADGEIDSNEVLDAVEDYFNDVITSPQVLDVVEYYFAS